MFLKVWHLLRYSYSKPVFLEPMTIRLRPRSDSWQTLHQFSMKWDPAPEGQTELSDLDGTSSSYLWFSGTHPAFSITATSWVETLRDNPFDYILGNPEFAELPARLPKHYQKSLEPYLQRNKPSAQVDRFAQEIVQEVNCHTVSFLSTLCSRIHDTLKITMRLTGDPMSPEELLNKSEGACRDLTVLFMDACRSLGLPARYTSGYYYGDEEFTDRQLHAWAEVYLPGAGWRGYDPSIGLVVSDQHVAVASGQNARLAAPTNGSFRGTGAETSMEFQIEMETAESLEALTRP